MYGFGYNGQKQLSGVARLNNDRNLSSVIVPYPLELQPILSIDNSQSIEQIEENLHVCNLTSVSIVWDSILFIDGNNRYNISGFKSDHCIKRNHPLEIKSGCLTWDSTILIDEAGVCYVTEGGKTTSLSISDTDDPHQLLDGATGFTSVTSGGKHCFGLTDSQRLVCLRRSECNSEENSPSLLLQPVSLQVAVRHVSCGKEHTLVLSRIGAVFSFGIGGQGQLGHGDVEHREKPTIVQALQGVSMVTVAAGGWHSVALSDIGDLYVWGWNERGQLGFLSKTIQSNTENAKDLQGEREFVNILAQPAILDVIPGSEVNIVKISCGSRHTAAISDSGEMYTWGWNKYGQLGHSDLQDRDTPTRISFFSDIQRKVTHVYCGYWNTIAITDKL